MKKYLLIFLAFNVTSYAMDTDNNNNDFDQNQYEKEKDDDEANNKYLFKVICPFLEDEKLNGQTCSEHYKKIGTIVKYDKFKKLLTEHVWEKHGISETDFSLEKFISYTKTNKPNDHNDYVCNETNEKNKYVFTVTCPCLGQKKASSTNFCSYTHYRICPPNTDSKIIQLLRKHLGTEHRILISNSNYSYLTDEFLSKYITYTKIKKPLST